MTQDYFFIKSKGVVYEVNIDPQDYDLVRAYIWCLAGKGYLFSNILKKQKNTYLLHRIIAERMGINTKDIDHIDGNKLNNRRSNLRGATRSQNQMNRGKQENNTSGYKGVSECKDGRKNKWHSILRLNGKCVYSKYFYTAEDAARAYDIQALKFHGEYAQLNFPRENYSTPASKDT